MLKLTRFIRSVGDGMTAQVRRGRVLIATGSDGRRHRIIEWIRSHGISDVRTSFRTADGKSVSPVRDRQYRIDGTDITLAF